MTIINIILCAILFRLRGGGIINQEPSTGGHKVPRWVYLAGMGTVIALNTTGWAYFAAWMWVAIVMGCLPTHALFSAIHGNPPGRRDSWQYQWMQDAALWLNDKLRKEGEWQNWKRYGMIYGVMRAIPLIPCAAINPLILLFLGHGVIYWLAGKQNKYNPVAIAELAIGGLIGALLQTYPT